MKHSTFNYVRTQRQRHALSEEELALLINQRAKSSIALIESGDRLPTLESAFALQVVFGIELRQLFPDYYDLVEDGVMRRANLLHESLEMKDDARSLTKRQLLEAMASRHEISFDGA